MSIKIVDGDLLQSDADIICHQCNCHNTFGAGIAKVIKEKFPEAWRVDCEADKAGANKLGNTLPAICELPDGKIKVVLNMYAQLGTSSQGERMTNYEAFARCLDKILASCSKKLKGLDRYPVIGFPYKIGCGLGGGDWKIIYGMLESFAEKYPGEVVIYKLKEA